MTAVPADVVEDNRRRLRHLGFGRVPVDIGTDPPGPVRPASEVLDRALAVHVVVSVAGGLEASVAGRWLAALGAGHALLAGETDYLADATEGLRVEDAARATGVESLAVLLWSLGLVGALPYEEPASAVSSVLPGPGALLTPEVAAASLRPEAQLRAEHDLLAGMAWALRADPDLEVGAAPGSLDPYVVRGRLTGLDWVLGSSWG